MNKLSERFPLTTTPAYLHNRSPKDIDEARDLWARICNLREWLTDGRTRSKTGGWPERYRENLHKFLGYWRHTPHDLRMTAKVLTRLKD